MANYLVIRLSAIGDVAMTIPVIYSVAKANPDDTFTVLTQKFLTTLFINRPSNLEVIGIDLKTTEKTLGGTIRFANKLAANNYDAVLDLHQVLRTMVISYYMRLRGKKVYAIDKGRKARKELIRRKNKKLHPLRPVIERYADVFREAGLQFNISFQSIFEEQPANISLLKELADNKKFRLGIAPFAKHQGKIYPVEQMKQVIQTFAGREDVSIYLFGGKGNEEDILNEWTSESPNIINMAGCYRLDLELTFISQLDLLISMDSANMHFASLVNTRVLSIWGATHPYVGFYGFNQKPEDIIMHPIECRPCSAFGQKECFRGDWACMTELAPEIILQKIETIYQSQPKQTQD